MPVSSPDSRLVHRETILLTLLAVVAIAGFLLTREVAKRERAENLADAAEWFAIGERALRDGQPGRAVDALRQATNHNRDNRAYVLTLARALGANDAPDDARRVLLGLRDIVPDDPDVNIELARLAARRQDVPEAQRFYQNALYSIWAPGRDAERLRLRVELITLLLQHEDRGRALSEIVALSINLPDTPPARVEAGRLFLAAGDPAKAYEQFGRALRLAPDDPDATAGAGEAAFARADYTAARRAFARATNLPPRLAALNAVARLVLESDPLETRLTLTARTDRLDAAVRQASRRLDECRAATGDRASALDPLVAEVVAFEPLLTARTLRDRPELVDHGVDLVHRAEQAAKDACGPPEGLDWALLLIGERHEGPA